ncbi:SH3 domain protein, putative [Paecilomyces variotii No. 5]|uniref:SH3 domain protein, putative n=1 Tax=Byssochlamys spectabilis (strain No. 5 / NBRC 109023) TaxID=1356009 RepID=V5FZB9_BYSSN|nr:SH3 domain protein, putative [Paecilomyces variotii No. 5]
MTRPQIIRADTIDLQSQQQEASAQDHTRQHARPAGPGRPAPHQEQSMRHAERDTKGEMHSVGSDEHQNGVDIYDEPDDMGSEDEMNGHYGNGAGGGSAEEEELVDGEGDDLLDDDMMDKISSSPSIDDEDIDFEFVYALHTFVATVEGQANATKGDTMVLLDDSNSYWWLVRVVKDGSIGYLPAEHIETPTERLARLNKHRNIDLSATMLGDNPEKSKNPLKKAMRRRNAKTVTFTAPTYVEASDVEYSTDEEEGEQGYFDDNVEASSRDVQDVHEEQDSDMVVEPLRPKQSKEKSAEEIDASEDAQESDPASSENPRTSEEMLDRQEEPMVSRSRNGTVRNTDSFFRDDSVETKKISLTPNLLRDESARDGSSSEAKESRGSMERIEKELAAGDKDKGKDDKKRKDKKSGMLSGLFKRKDKDKKNKTSEDDGEELEKSSEELSRSSPPPKTSSESLESRSPKAQGPQRQSSKLQKQPPVETSTKELQQVSGDQQPAINKVSPTKENFGPSIRQVTSPQMDDVPEPQPLRLRTSSETAPKEQTKVELNSYSPSKSNFGTSIQPAVDRSKPRETELRQDSAGQVAPKEGLRVSPPQPSQSATRVSPVDVSPIDTQSSAHPPGLMADTSSPEEQPVSPLSSSSPELVEAPEPKREDGAPDTAPSSSAPTPTWSDASLLSYLENESDIRDLLIIVHDKSNVPPAGPDHPITGSLFKEESRRLKEMSGQLDDLLGSWLARKTEKVATR